MEIARHWRLKAQRYNLIGEICEKGHHVFPPRDVCPDCHGEAKIPFQFSGKGVVYSYTTIHEAPTGFEKDTPYTVALIKLDEGPMITAQLTDIESHMESSEAWVDQAKGWEEIIIEDATEKVFDIEIGMPVEMVTRKLNEDGDNGLINYGYKFRPVFERETSTLSK